MATSTTARPRNGVDDMIARVDRYLARVVDDVRLSEVIPLLEAGAGYLSRARFHALAEQQQDAMIVDVR